MRLVQRLGARLAISGGLVLVLAVLVSFLILLVRTRWGPLHRLDLDTAQDFNRYLHHHPGQIHTWKLISSVGGPTPFRIAAAVVAVALLLRRKIRYALFLAAVMGGAALLSGGVKLAVNRARPVLDVPVDRAPGASFPSGHALTSFVAVAALILILRAAASRTAWTVAVVVGALVVVLVGLSRVVLGVHFVSDVVGGWLIGGAWVAMCSAVARVPSRWVRPSGQPVV